MKKPHCTRCGRALTDPYSVAVGMGPECRGGLARKGWKFPKPKYRVRDGHVVLVGVIGKVERPAVNEEAMRIEKASKKLLDEAEQLL